MVDVMPSSTEISPTNMPSDPMDGPARKQQRRNGSSGTSSNGNGGPSTSASSASQSGPPYICPTCQTSYSRLEYLRRHERRHADIRPFVCDCGKGFSRSDVLSRHKRQCAVHLNGGSDDAGATESAVAAPKRSTIVRGKKGGANRSSRKSSGLSKQEQSFDEQRDEDALRRDFAPSPSSNILPGSSFGSFSQSNLPPPSAPPPLLPPAPYGSGEMANEFSRSANANNGTYGNMAHHLSALNSFTNQQHNYPSSPESNGTVSQHSSPRFASRDMSRHGSNSSRFSLRKNGSSFDHITPRSSSNGNNASSHYPQEFWEALDPAAKNVSSMGANDFVSGPPASHPTFSLPAEATAAGALASVAAGGTGASTTGASNLAAVTTPRGEPQRFSVSTGPLSPFSSIALTSSMSPYLSAFSNARDTPFVASPSRGGIPGTPGSNLNIFDWTMRPPSKPAISTTNVTKRDSLSMQGNQSQSSSKRKRGDEEETNRGEDALLNADADERSAAVLLDSLRNAGSRSSFLQPPSSNTDSTSATPSSLSLPASATSTATSTTITPDLVSSSATGTTNPSITSQPSEPFFEQRNVTVGPETFLLRLQGGAQEREQFLGPDGLHVPPSDPNLIGNNAFDAGGLSLSQMGAANPSSWGANQLGGETPNGSSSMAWLMSPGVQQIINTFTASNPGDNGSYFSGAPSQVNSASEPAPPSLPSANMSTFALEKAISNVRNPFYIPAHLFRACYSVHHWKLPPITRLSVIALHSQQNLLKHFPIIHEPTFRLDTTPGCLAFSLSMIGCHQHGRMWWAGEEVVPKRLTGLPRTAEVESADGKCLTDTRFDEEDGQELVRPVVMAEKTDMLMRSFASRAKTEKDRVSVVQALMLFQSDRFLSSDVSTRTLAAMNHGPMVKLARKAGIFDSNAAHSGRMVSYTGEDVLRTTIFEAGDLCFSYSFLPTYLPGCPDEEKVWRQWSEYAGRRRTAHLIFIMDTVANLDAGVKNQVTLDEVAHLPLPTPDTIWRAPTSKAWKKALEEYQGPTLSEALGQLLDPSSSDKLNGDVRKAGIHGRHGPFARLVMVIALLRGIIHVLEDRKRMVSRPSPLQAWLPSQKDSEGRDDVKAYRAALALWRQAWDNDDLCLAASGPAGRAKAAKLSLSDGDMAWMGSHYLFASQTASGATPLSDDALPFYWLAYVLLAHAASAGEEDSGVVMVDEGESPMGKASKLIKDPDGSDDKDKLPDFRAMLRYAKAFVTNSEQATPAA